MVKTEFRQFEIPKELEVSIEKALQALSTTLQDSKKIAAAVKQMSDFYIANPQAATPWNESWAVIAQLAYYLPLNYLRAQAVIDQGAMQGFFDGLKSSCEVGSGLGALSMPLSKKINVNACLEISNKASQIHQKISKQSFQILKSEKDLRGDLLALSYVLTEVTHLEKYFDHFNAILVIEPSTSQDGRYLMELRERLIKKGFFIWAPCTHQKNCPLLHESKKDWCHDRIHLKMPKWFLDIEANLPFKNKTITYSYLLARKDKKPQNTLKTRIVGDLLPEKGKTRIMVCRQDKREFLSWLSKDKLEVELYRGDLLDLTQFDLEEKSNELRIKKN